MSLPFFSLSLKLGRPLHFHRNPTMIRQSAEVGGATIHAVEKAEGGVAQTNHKISITTLDNEALLTNCPF